MFADLSFQAMGCQSRVVVAGDDSKELATWAIDRIEQLEARWSRFRDDSEISRLNHGDGEPTPVSRDTAVLIHHGMRAFELTDGRFDPTMLDELVGHGYDRSHPDLKPAQGSANTLTDDADDLRIRLSRCSQIEVDPGLDAVRLPAGVSFDPGGIGKGLGADIVATELMERGATGAMIDLGGDVRVIGDHPDDGPVWTVVVANPRSPDQELFRLGLRNSGIATSSQLLRRWATDDGDRHHLLDARDGRPSTSPVAAVVVATNTTWWAEVVAKTALIAGFEQGERMIVEAPGAGVMFDFDGEPHDVGLLAAANPAES